MIERLKDSSMFLNLMELAKQLPNTPLEELGKMLINGFNKDTAQILVCKENEDITGFTLTSIEEFDGNNVAFIQGAVIKPNNDNYGLELMEKIRSWASDMKVKYIYMITNRNTKGFSKKYNFEEVGKVMRRTI